MARRASHSTVFDRGIRSLSLRRSGKRRTLARQARCTAARITVSSEIDQARAARTGPYSAYHNRPAAFAVSHLAEVGPGTPGGEHLRRYWHPIMLESELKDSP